MAPRRGPFRREGGERSFPCTPQLVHGFADSSVSLSLPHHRTAKAAYYHWPVRDAEPGMELEPRLAKAALGESGGAGAVERTSTSGRECQQITPVTAL